MKQTKQLRAALASLACLIMAACANPEAPGPAPADTGGLEARDIADGGLTLYWDAVQEADSYRIYWKEGDANPENAQVITTISTDTTYTMENLSSGAVYYFWVLAVKDSLTIGSFKDPLEVRMSVPAPRAEGIILARDMNSIHVLWEPVGGASSYEVWHSLVNRVGAAQKWAGPIEGTRTEVTGLLNNNTYYFWLRSVDAAGPSGYSGVRSETTGEPQAPAKPVIKWTGRLRNALLAIWEPSANAFSYELRYSTGNNAETAEHVITGLSGVSYMAEGLVKGLSYNFWVRARNTMFQSDWSDMRTVTVGEGLPQTAEGLFFSRYPLTPPGRSSRPYYMDGYRIGPAFEMRTVFPFNKAKYPNSEYRGFPGPLAEAGMVREGALGGMVYDDDQYVLYVCDGLGGLSLGLVRAVLERPYSAEFNLYYAVIEPFLMPGRPSAGYEVIHFRCGENSPDYLMGINGGPTLTNLDLETLQDLSTKNWDREVAYPCMRLIGDFLPELIRPERIAQYLAVKLPDLDRNAAYSYFERWNEEKGMHNWQDREQFPASELMEYVFW